MQSKISTSSLNSKAKKVKTGEKLDIANIQVFNHFYVEEKLREFLDASGESETIFKFGDNADAATSQLAAEEFIAHYKARLKSVSSADKDCKESLKRSLSLFKEQVVEALNVVDPDKYSSYRFDVRVAKRHLDKNGLKSLNTDDYGHHFRTATMDAPDTISAVVLPETSSAKLLKQLRLATSQLTTAIVIQELAADQEVDDWVRLGLRLHNNESVCKFCSGLLTEDRKVDLRKHFDDSSNLVREELARIAATSAAERSKLESWVQDLPKKSEFYPDLQQAADEHISRILNWATRRRDELDNIMKLVERKIEKFYEPLDLPNDFRLEDAPIDDLEQLINAHNLRSADHAEAALNSANAIVEHLAERHSTQYKIADARVPRLADLQAKLSARLQHHEDRAAHYKAAQTDAAVMAKSIDDDVKNVFGRQDIDVRPSSDATGYVIARHGLPATNLSEGERKIIALSYFVRSLEADDVDQDNLVVVVDDPVSSLDRENMYAAFAWLNEKLDHYPQSIVLTHDFELLRLYTVSTSNQRKASLKKIGGGNAAEKWFPRVNFLELSRCENFSHPEQNIQLQEFPVFLLQHNSEYHYLFNKVVTTARSDGDDSLLPLVGNASRRLLEGFATFEGPAGTSFQEKIDMACKGKVDDIVKNRVVKFAHGQSHRENPNPSTGVDLPTVRKELQTLLGLIRGCNSEHFERMCKATQTTPDW
ncbi:AAA family ATPase [Glutamicibacter sp. NPDC087583]|uniref:AAA family ATPase n=1 Tax=Glutamicibacter sp. NPDC087583 TaxID=3363995 RepID=UPI00381B7AB7